MVQLLIAINLIKGISVTRSIHLNAVSGAGGRGVGVGAFGRPRDAQAVSNQDTSSMRRRADRCSVKSSDKDEKLGPGSDGCLMHGHNQSHSD